MYGLWLQQLPMTKSWVFQCSQLASSEMTSLKRRNEGRSDGTYTEMRERRQNARGNSLIGKAYEIFSEQKDSYGFLMDFS